MFFSSKMFDWVLNTPLMTTSVAASSEKLIFHFHIHLIFYHYSIDFRINMTGNKHKWMQKFENVRIFIKCTLQYIYNMVNLKFVLLCPQIKLHNEILNTAPNFKTKCTTKGTTCCTINSWKSDSSLCVSFVKQAKNKVYILYGVFKVLLERFH